MPRMHHKHQAKQLGQGGASSAVESPAQQHQFSHCCRPSRPRPAGQLAGTATPNTAWRAAGPYMTPQEARMLPQAPASSQNPHAAGSSCRLCTQCTVRHPVYVQRHPTHAYCFVEPASRQVNGSTAVRPSQISPHLGGSMYPSSSSAATASSTASIAAAVLFCHKYSRASAKLTMIRVRLA